MFVAATPVAWRRSQPTAVVSRYAQLSGRAVARSPQAAYGILDGLFQQALLGYITGRTAALDELTAQVRELMPYLLEPVAA
jgi:TetR/AcrR family transcriptional repressor of bet genes